jgi:hypothetical protein
VRKHVGGELLTVDDYRNRYAQYRSDPALRAVHAAFPFLMVWDDHEVDNNYAGPERRERHAGRAIRRAPRRGLQGLLRAHAAAALVDTEGRAAAALPFVQLRDAGQHLDARYASVPHRPAVRRQRSASM